MKPIAPSLAGLDPGALFRINLTYFWRHGRWPKLAAPSLFTELVQLRKLIDRDPRMPAMADKLAVKAVVAERLGQAWVVPTLWSGETLPERSRWAAPIVVKARHGCKQNAFVRGPDARWAQIRARTAGWMREPYGGWLDEWLYAHIDRGLLVEPFVGNGRTLPVDYKFYVFDGRATHVQVHLDRATDHRWWVYDTDWRALSARAPAIGRPSALSAMIAAAEEMARGFSFARVDFYQPATQPLFGEICFYPGSGLDPFDPPALDAEMGRLWLRGEDFGALYRAGSVVRGMAGFGVPRIV